MFYLLVFMVLLFSAYFVPYYVLPSTTPSLNFFVFWTLFAVSSILLALVIMSKWREEQ